MDLIVYEKTETYELIGTYAFYVNGLYAFSICKYGSEVTISNNFVCDIYKFIPLNKSVLKKYIFTWIKEKDYAPPVKHFHPLVAE